MTCKSTSLLVDGIDQQQFHDAFDVDLLETLTVPVSRKPTEWHGSYSSELALKDNAEIVSSIRCIGKAVYVLYLKSKGEAKWR